jgi:hypothetical protein
VRLVDDEAQVVPVGEVDEVPSGARSPSVANTDSVTTTPPRPPDRSATQARCSTSLWR